jgi:hypothetical protein
MDSTCPHRAHCPLDLPWRWWICSLAGIFPLAICQRKILIFRGSLAFQRSFSCGRLGPWFILRYSEETENFPWGSKAHLTWSTSEERWTCWRSCTRSSQASTSSGPKERLNWSVVGEIGRAWATKIDLELQMSKSRGYLIARGPSPCHQSVQKKILSPEPGRNFAPNLKRCLILFRLHQNCEPPWLFRAKMLSTFIYFVRKSLNQRLLCSAGSKILQIHLIIKAVLKNLELMIPSPPWSFGRHTSSHFTHW